MSRPRLKVTGPYLGAVTNSPITRMINGGSNAGAHRELSLSGLDMNFSAHSQASENQALDQHIGYRLRARRRFRLMSEARLALALDISRDQLFTMEEGREQTPPKLLLAAAEILGISPRYFFQGFEAPKAAGVDCAGKARDVDRWFRDNVSPHEGLFLKVAQHFIGNLDASRDLVHDAYATILSNDRWRTVTSPKAYVSQVVTNLARDQLKRNKIVPMDQYADIEQFGFADASPDALKTVEDRERLRIVVQAIDKLPRQCRQVFIMRRIDDIPPREIAKRLNLGIGTIESHLTRGMSELHKYLENHRKGIQLKVWLASQSTTDVSAIEAKERQR